MAPSFAAVRLAMEAAKLTVAAEAAESSLAAAGRRLREAYPSYAAFCMHEPALGKAFKAELR